MSQLPPKRRFPTRLALVAGVIAILGLLFGVVDLEPDLGHLDVVVLSGPTEGNYHALAADLAAQAADRTGRLTVVASQGTRDNLERLAAANAGCDAHFALAQDGVTDGAQEGARDGAQAAGALRLVARLPKSESVFFLGRDAARLTKLAELRGLRIGIGPAKSGTDALLRQLFADEDLAALGVTLQNHPLGVQVDLVARGSLDLGAFVVDEDADIVRRAVRDQGLELANFANLDVIARRYPFLWHGRIGAGQFDPVRLLPPSDRRVLRVDTLLLKNDCPSHAQTVAMLSVLTRAIPDLVEHNRKRAGNSSFVLDDSARAYFEKGGPELADEHVPWLVDIMPPSNWVYVVMSISVLFNLMGLGHRFRLWRIDAGRVRLDSAIRELLGIKLTAEEIHDMAPTADHLRGDLGARLAGYLDELSRLRGRCRKQSLSMLVPMGQEMGYRYQEDQIEEALVALRLFLGRLRAARGAEAEAGDPEVSDAPDGQIQYS